MKHFLRLYNFLLICSSLTFFNLYAASNFNTAVEKDYSIGIKPFDQSAKAVDLGMNDVPVLNQEQYGTPVVFSSIAAIDALLGKGDFIDQNCIEALNPFSICTFADTFKILNELGIVEKNSTQYKCERGKSLSDTQYKEMVSRTVTVTGVQYAEMKPTLNKIRESLDNGRRVILDFELESATDSVAVQGFDILINGKKHNGGLWACKQSRISNKNYCKSRSLGSYCAQGSIGHVIVVIGYDNKQRLLKIRNSWGNNTGENGDFYMTYEFFEKMVNSATEVWM